MDLLKDLVNFDQIGPPHGSVKDLVNFGQVGSPGGSVNRFSKFWSDWTDRWICKQI